MRISAWCRCNIDSRVTASPSHSLLLLIMESRRTYQPVEINIAIFLRVACLLSVQHSEILG